ncbi:hypothetical protein [Clostridium sp. C2-6-12]|uniref:hypothetical protein n=1 Tax=Clostridium sp. C2-6-12 TaxID=2698832 RepID=UPI00136F86CE|nr:hypothetical protein [Clostridium sp. C2-6-12]
MKDFLIKYKGISLYEEDLFIVKASSVKDAVSKFRDYMIKDIGMFELFQDFLPSIVEGEYFEAINNECDEEFDLDQAIERYIRSKKGFNDKRRFKNLDLDKFIVECFNILSDPSIYYRVSNETKEAIFGWIYEEVGALNLNKIRVLE